MILSLIIYIFGANVYLHTFAIGNFRFSIVRPSKLDLLDAQDMNIAAASQAANT